MQSGHTQGRLQQNMGTFSQEHILTYTQRLVMSDSIYTLLYVI